MQDILADEISQKVSAIVILHSASSRAFAFENFTDTRQEMLLIQASRYSSPVRVYLGVMEGHQSNV